MNHALLPENVTIRPAELDVNSIIVLERQRKVTDEHVTLLRNSIQQTGKQIVPIAVSERPNGKLVLIDGAHRLEAAKRDGRETIRAELYSNLAEDQEGVLEFVTNRARKDLSPAEILEAWESFDLPMYKTQARDKQAAAGLMTLVARGKIEEAPLTPAGSKRVPEPSISIREAAIERTGHKPEYLAKIAEVRDLAKNEDVPEAVRSVAQRGYERLQSTDAKVEPVYKTVQKVRQALLRQESNPQELLEQDAEQRLDDLVRHTTLLQEKLDGNLRDFLLLAGRRGQMGRDMLRATRIALVRSLTSVVVIECEVSENASESLQTIGREVTTLLSQESMKALSLRQAESEAADV